jgi:hypothetical protein
MRERDTATLVADIDDYGPRCLVVHIGYGIKQPAHPSGYFSITADTYSSRGAFEVGASHAIIACGCQHETILRAFPELAPIVALHMSDVETGEPSSAVANGWYWYSSHDGRGTHAHGERSDFEFACDHLRVDSIAGPHNRESFERYVDTLRPRWRAEADAAVQMIEALGERRVTVPSEVPSGETYSHKFDHGLSVSARLLDEPGYRNGIGFHFEYSVTVRGPERVSYRTTYGGSVADYDDGRIDARQAALGVLHEFCEYIDQSAEELAQEFGLEPDESAEDRKTLRAMKRAADRLGDALSLNREMVS